MNTVFPDGYPILRQLYAPETIRLIKEMDVDYLLLISPYKLYCFSIGPVFVTVGIAKRSCEAELSTIVFDLKENIVERRFDMKTEGKIYLVLAGLTGLIVGKELADFKNNLQLVGERMAIAIGVSDNLEPVRVVVMGGLIKKSDN